VLTDQEDELDAEIKTRQSISADRHTRPPFDLREIVYHLLYRHTATVGGFVLLIGGPGCVGKSTFAEELAQELTKQNQPTIVLELDCYLIERSKRQTGDSPIGGYNPAAYRLREACRDIHALLGGRRVWVSPYDKAAGTRAPPIELRGAKHLIIEGSMALRDPIYSYGSFSLFLDASQDVLYTNRKRRELGYGFSLDEIDRKFDLLLRDYTAYIAPQRLRAKLVVEIDERYEFRCVKVGDV
jgi:uridine kinase